MTRRLIVIRRSVASESVSAYDACWRALRDPVVAARGHAWRFRSPERPGDFLEFIEFADGADTLELPEVADALRALDHLAPAAGREEWLDSNLS